MPKSGNARVSVGRSESVGIGVIGFRSVARRGAGWGSDERPASPAGQAQPKRPSGSGRIARCALGGRGARGGGRPGDGPRWRAAGRAGGRAQPIAVTGLLALATSARTSASGGPRGSSEPSPRHDSWGGDATGRDATSGVSRR
jgi:hypothetical protein